MKTIEKHVELTEAERARLIKVTNTGTAKEILYANIVLMCSRKQAPKKISEALNISKQTVNNVKQRFSTMALTSLQLEGMRGKRHIRPR